MESLAMYCLKEFAKNIKIYGGIRKLFSELEKVSPEYADRVERAYIQAIYEITKED